MQQPSKGNLGQGTKPVCVVSKQKQKALLHFSSYGCCPPSKPLILTQRQYRGTNLLFYFGFKGKFLSVSFLQLEENPVFMCYLFYVLLPEKHLVSCARKV